MQKNTSRLAKVAKASLGLAACVAATVTAFAAATYWPDGDNLTSNQGAYGFVGKGDVQIPWGWNNNTLQEEAVHVSFSYVEVGTFTVICAGHPNSNQNPKTFSHKVIGIEAAVTRELRKNTVGQITGFSLTGLGQEVSSGDGCPTPWTIEVDRFPNDDAGTVIGLVAHHPDQEDLVLDTTILP